MIRARTKKARRKHEVSCGTQAAYEAHLRNNERPCSFCLPGSSTYSDGEIAALIRELRERDRDKQLWRQYRITHATFVRLLAEQRNRCACCQSPEPGKNGWCIDHDHSTGHIRGILCSNCNTGIGMLGDDLNGVQRAVTYLQEHLKRGGYPRDKIPPTADVPQPKISKIMQECFDLFAQGVIPNKAVMLKKLDPSVMKEIFAAWKARDTEAPILRVDHCYHIIKEAPRRCVCACGFVISFHDIASMSDAIQGMEMHILEEAGKEMERRREFERAVSSDS